MGNYAVSDLHGCYKQWKQIQSFCKDSDRIYVLGDCIDREIDGFKTLQSVLNDPRTTLLCGNHEDMMLDALEGARDGDTEAFYMWFSNGGSCTYDSWCDAGRDFNWIGVLKNLPTHTSYINQEGTTVYMNHSGVMPKPYYPMYTCGRRALIWDRKSVETKSWHNDENEVIVHGHTPICLMPQFKKVREEEIEPGAFWYCDNHRCNIDNGGCWTGYICLLDLDTWEEHIFYA